MTKQYRVKGIAGVETYIELLTEVADGYETRITSVNAYGARESCEFISNELLESCLRTGYLLELTDEVEVPMTPEPALIG